jgi:hypothetical protein
MANIERQNNLKAKDKFFIGEVPPFLKFEIQYHSLFDLVESHKQSQYYKENIATGVALIGLVAHFEAFCKHHFAALINCSPEILVAFCEKRGEPNIEISSLFSFKTKIENNLGYILSEKYDFGSAKMINGLFRDLVNVTPFSKKEMKSFDDILQTRNLLVHHGGYFTLQHLKKNKTARDAISKLIHDAVKITTESYHEIGEFLFEMAMKMVRSTIPPYVAEIKKFKKLSNKEKNTIKSLYQALYDNLDD